MIETTIETLTAEVSRLTREIEALSAMMLTCTTALTERFQAAPTEAPVAASAPSPAPAIETVEAPKASEGFTPEELQSLILRRIREEGLSRDKVAALIADMSGGKKKVTDIAPERLGEFAARLAALS